MSDADVCHGSSIVRQINATIGNMDITLTDLQPDQLYLISVTSISAVNSQSDVVHLRLKTEAEGLTAGIVTLLVIVGLLFIILLIAAVSCLVRYVITVCQHRFVLFAKAAMVVMVTVIYTVVWTVVTAAVGMVMMIGVL